MKQTLGFDVDLRDEELAGTLECVGDMPLMLVCEKMLLSWTHAWMILNHKNKQNSHKLLWADEP